MAKQVYYDVQRHKVERSEYEHLYVRVFENPPYVEGYIKCNTRIEFKWQGDSKTDHWYAGRMTVEAENYEDFDALAKLARRLMKDVAIWRGPEQLFDKLEKMRAVETVYDSRLGEQLLLDDVLPPEYASFVDDSRALGNEYATYGVLARDADEARKLIVEKATAAGNFDFIKKFAAHDYPLNLGRWDAPDPTPGREKAYIEPKVVPEDALQV